MSGKIKVNEIIPSSDLLLDGNVVVNGTLAAHNYDADLNINSMAETITQLEARLADLEFSIENRDSNIINITIYENDERFVTTAGSPIELDSFGVDKKSSTSILLINGTIAGYGGNSGTMTQRWEYGVDSSVIAQALMYDEKGYSKIYPTTAVIRNHTVTGYQNLKLLYFNDDGSGGHRPVYTYNPNSTDHVHLGQTKSVYTIYEIEE